MNTGLAVILMTVGITSAVVFLIAVIVIVIKLRRQQRALKMMMALADAGLPAHLMFPSIERLKKGF